MLCVCVCVTVCVGMRSKIIQERVLSGLSTSRCPPGCRSSHPMLWLSAAFTALLCPPLLHPRRFSAPIIDASRISSLYMEAQSGSDGGLSGSKVRELLDAGLGEEQVRQLLGAEGVAPNVVESLFEEAQKLPAKATPPAAPPPVVASSPPPPTAVIQADEKLYPMPGVEATTNQIFLPFVPFGIARGAFLISSVVASAIVILLVYLLILTSSST